MKTLIIVESPSKAKKISSFLGDDFTTLASFGHITDLAKGGKLGLGVDIDRNFTPRYVITDGQVETLDRLIREANNCDRIFVASDEDREGEAIAWHLWSRLEDLGKPIKRIEFNEITKKAVLKAIENPRDINMPLFRSQEARRILDRLVGFMASPFLMNFFGSNLSAGRVQSVVARMVVDREREIENFKPEEYWVIQAALVNAAGASFLAKYEARVSSAEDAKSIQAELEGNQLDAIYSVNEVLAAEEKKRPAPPLITSKLQQIMSKSHNVPADRTMKAAQFLYENGYVTYIRTDSIRVNDDALKEARTFLKENSFEIPRIANVFKNKDSAQDAHECIRPTDLSIHPNDLPSSDQDEKLVYEIIWRYFLASQMFPAIYNTLKVSLRLKKNSKHFLKASGKAIKSLGYLEMLNISDDAKIEIPNLKKGEELTLFGNNPITIEQKYTQPPARYSESHLLEVLDKKSIGRPATYAELLSKITVRNYVEKHGNVYHPTDLGKKITDELVKFFSFMEYDYTSNLELSLDKIAQGNTNHLDILKDFYKTFSLELKKAYHSHSNMGDIFCEKCEYLLLKMSGQYGEYYKCANSACKYKKSINRVA
jgi:DNA topoisomerase I